jgi:hypothetical protein
MNASMTRRLFGSTRVPPGLRTAIVGFTLVVRFVVPGCLAFDVRAAEGSRVTIDADRVLVINGRRVFPIAFTMPPPPDGRTPSGKDALEELRDAGANFLRTGVMGGPWNDAAFELEHRYQDAAARHGIHCLVNLRELGSIGPEDDAKEARLRQLIAQFKDHPGMGVWKHVDEPEWGKQPIPPMRRASEIIRELDPHHPIEITHAPRGRVESLRAFNDCTDIVATDIYPIGYPPGGHSLLPNKAISMVGDYTRTTVEVADRRLAVWMTLQIAWSGVIKPGKTLRFPTFVEERFMTYQAIINGARGLIFFGGHIPKAMSREDAALGWNWRFWNRVLRPVVEEIGERSPLYPALIAPESSLPVQTSAPREIEFCVREADGGLFLVSCQREGETVNVQFSGLPAWAKHGEVMFEPPRTVEAAGGRFTDWFAPFDVHIYRFRR